MQDLTSKDLQMERQARVEAYKKELNKLIPYLGWLKDKQGQLTAKSFTDEGIGQTSIAFPVYDGTLLNFIKVLSSTNLINPNYVYDYRKYRIQEGKGELQFIASAQSKDISVICSILSRYALKGRVKGNVWTEGVKNGVYLQAILKIQELLERYDTSPRQ